VHALRRTGMRLLRAALLAVSTSLVVGPAGCKPRERTPPTATAAAPATLDAAHQPLRERFESDASRPRLLLLVSPT
jgi:hypothetical protein